MHPANQDFTWPHHQPPFRLLTPEQASSFDERGYVLLEAVLDPAVLATVEAEIDPLEHEAEEQLRAAGETGIARPDEITFTTFIAARSRFVNRFVRSSPLVDIAIDLIGPDVRLYWDQSVYKKPETPKPFPWHQDNGYTFITPQHYLTCWIPLTDATVDNGCPWIWPGAHRLGTLAHRPSPLGHVCKEDDTDTVPVEAQVGDVVVFSSLTPHRTGPNTTSSVRKAYIVQYATDGARTLGGGLCDHPERQFVVARGGSAVEEGRD